MITFPTGPAYQRGNLGMNGVTDITGTDSDAGLNPSGMSLTQVRLSYVNGSTYYWNGSTFTTTPVNQWQAAGGAGATNSGAAIGWDYNAAAHASIVWPTDGVSHLMTLDVQGEDQATASNGAIPGNFSPIKTITFTIDDVAPVGVITYPATNAAVSSNTIQMTGTDSDITGDPAGSGIKAVNGIQVEISTGLGTKSYWTAGSTWSTNQTWISTTTSSPWFYTIPSTALLSGTSYYLRLQLTDNAGNVFTSQPSTFTYNTTAPTVTISNPTNNAFYNAVNISSANWSGTTVDNGTNPTGLSTVTVTVADITGAPITLLSSVPASGTPYNWTYVSTLTLVNAHQYKLSVTALNNAQVSTSTFVTFTYDVQTPTSSVTNPSTLYITTWTVISGKATDQLAANPSGFSATGVAVAMQQLTGVAQQTGGNWWNGSAFSAGNPIYFTGAFVGASSGTWSYNLPPAFQNALTSGASYCIVSRSTDTAGNTEFGLLGSNIPLGNGAVTTFNVTAPTATITVPLPGLAGVTGLAITSGTVTGKVPVTSVAIAIENLTLHRWMDLPVFNFTFDVNQSTPFFIPVTTLSNNVWTFTAGGNLSAKMVGDNYYAMVVQATDASGIVQSTYVLNTSSFTILMDTTTPTLPVITFPSGPAYQRGNLGMNGVTDITGTDSDAGLNPSGMSLTQVRLSYVNGSTYYWNGSTFTTTPVNQWQAAGGAGATNSGAAIGWDYNAAAHASIVWPTDGVSHLMTLDVQGEDQATASNGAIPGNFSPIKTITFTIDDVAPIGVITYPATNAAVSSNTIQMTGTDSDITGDPAGSGIKAVNGIQVEISTGLGTKSYWTAGSTWSTNQTWISTTTSSPWFYTIPSSALSSGILYYLRLQVTDNAGNVFTSQPSTFSYNTTSPTVTISSPVTGNFYSAVILSTPFAGTDSPSGAPFVVVSTVNLTLQDMTVGTSYYNGISWQPGAASFPAQGSINPWSFNNAGLTYVNDHQYQLTAAATDNSGKTGTTNVTFVYDVQKPTSAVTSPVPGFLTAWSTISGVASDRVPAANHPSLLSTGAVSVAVQQMGLGWWNGGDFTGGSPNYNLFTVVNTTTTGGSPNTWITNLPFGFTNSLVTGTTYFIVSRSTDNAGNTEFGAIPPGVGVTVLYDSAPATSVITLPVNAISYNHLTTITGTANDAVSGLANVQVTFKNVNTNQFYDYSDDSFDLGVASWTVVTGTTAWSYTTPPKITGGSLSGFQFRVFARAINNAGVIPPDPDFNVGGILFRYDIGTPTSTINAPATASVFVQSTLPTTLSGSANDTTSGGSGIASSGVKIRILRSDGLLFNGVSYASDDGSFPLNANYSDGNPGSWSLAVSTSLAWQDNFRYSIIARAQDQTTNNGAPNTPNFQTPYSTVTFTVDETAPQTAITAPPDQGAYSSVQPLTNITGTATDPNAFASGVARVQLSVQQLNAGATNYYFNGTSFASTTQYMLVAAGTTTWSYFTAGLSAGNLINGASYRINALSTDAAGNADVVTATSTFVFDTSKPLGTVTFPANGDVQENPNPVFGTATDVGPAGVGKVEISLFDQDDNLYLDSTTLTFTSGSQEWIQAVGTDNWSYPPNGQSIIWISGKHYVLQARVTDRAGNVESAGNIGSGNTFIVTAPASKLQVIVDTTTPNFVAGTSRDIIVKALDNSNNVAITYTGQVSFQMDNGFGPETPSSGIPPSYTFVTGDAGVHTFSNGFTPIKAALNRSLTVGPVGVQNPLPSTGTQSGINVVPNTTVGLQILISPEANRGGQMTTVPPGKTSPPLQYTAGANISITVNAVDQYWNVTPSSNPATVNVVTSDIYAAVPGNRPLTSGTTVFNTTLVTAGVQTFTASGAGTPNTSSNITITAGSANRMLVVLPGQSQVQGSPTGLSGSPNNILAGQTLKATVYGVDSFNNTDTSDNLDKIWASLPNDLYAARPPSQTLVSGTTIFALVPVTALSQVVQSTAAMVNPSYMTASFSVNPDTATVSSQRIQLILSGETAVPGLPPYGISNGGKTGSPQLAYAGIQSTVTARLVDRFYNLITTGLSMTAVNLHTSDTSALNTDSQVTLVNGVVIGTVTYYTQSNPQATSTQGWTITGSDAGHTGYITDASTNVIVWPGPVTGLRVLTAVQSPLEGSSPAGAGKTNPGSPGAATAGVPFPVTIQAVDQYWNTNFGLSGHLYTANTGDHVTLNTNDVNIQGDANLVLIQGIRTFAGFTPRTAQTNWTFTGVDTDSATISSQTVSGINVSANTSGSLFYQILLPGETASPGNGVYPAGGKTGGSSPTPQTAGVPIPSPGVIVNLVDPYWNPVQSIGVAPWVTLSVTQSTDTYAVLPSSQQMSNAGGGYNAVFIGTVTLNTAGPALSHQLQASDPNHTYNPPTNSAFFTVNPNALATLQLLMPGETAAAGKPANWSFAGDPAGKLGTPNGGGTSNAFIAGQPYTITVNATDSYFNIISTNGAVNLTSNDQFGTPSVSTPIAHTLSAGTTTFIVTLLSAENASGAAINHRVTASWSLTGSLSPNFLMQPYLPTKLLILAPGETASPGNLAGNGKTGVVPSSATAGQNYTVVVRITDNWFNAVGNANFGSTIHLTTNDPYAPADSDQPISAGANNYVATFSNHQFRKSTNTGWTITASTSGAGDPNYGTATDAPIYVNPDTIDGGQQLLMLLPGETFDPGNISDNGRSTSPNGEPVGATFPATVLGTDQYFNLIPDTNSIVVTVGANASLFSTIGPPPQFTLTSGSGTVNVSINAANPAAQLYVNQNSGGTYAYAAATSTVFAVNAGLPTKLQLLIQGESAAPGNTAISGQTNTPSTPFTAGQIYSATVNSVDNFYNPVSTSAQVLMVVSDTNTTQNNIVQSLVNGTTIFALQFITATNTGWTVTVSTVSGAALTKAQSVPLTVNPAAATHIMLTVPGVALSSGNVSAGGLSPNSPTAETAGTVFRATATITDNYFNAVTGATGNVWFHTSDPYDVDGSTQGLINGTTSFAVQMFQQGMQSISVYCVSPSCNYSTGTVANIPISSGPINSVLVRLPGEGYQPGNPPAFGGTGKTIPDNPGLWVAGTQQLVTVYATDAYWNQTSSAATVSLSAPNDPNAQGIGTKQMVNGTTTFAVTLFKAVDYNGFSQTLLATINGISNNTFTSPAFTVYPDSAPASARFLRILVNGESAAPGTVGLKNGAPSLANGWDTHFVAGTTITFRVDATDTWGNLISTNPTVNLVTDDPNAKPASILNIPLTQGTTQFSWNWVTKRTPDLGAPAPFFTAATATASGFNPGSDYLVVDPDRTKKNLQILVQGEFPAQGTGYWPSGTGGKTGAPQTFAAGAPIPITVQTVDDYWNLVEAPSAGDPQIYVQTNDPFSTPKPLVNGSGITHNVGTLVQSIALATKNLAPGWVLVSSGAAGGAQFGVNNSSPVPVDAGAIAKLQILVPGESAVSGDATHLGKSGTPQTQTAGVPFAMLTGSNTIRAVDALYNTVSTNGVVTVSLSDTYGAIAPTSINISGGVSVTPFNVTLAVSTQTICESGYLCKWV